MKGREQPYSLHLLCQVLLSSRIPLLYGLGVSRMNGGSVVFLVKMGTVKETRMEIISDSVLY